MLKKVFLLINIFILFEALLLQDTEECGSEYACFTFPDGCTDSSCTLIYKWQDKGNYIEFTISGNFNAVQAYLAIGFSTDRKMGDDSVVICNTNYTVKNYYNTGRTSPLVLSGAETFGLSNISITITDWFTCKFNRLKKSDTNTKFFDLNNDYYVLAAFGYINKFNNEPTFHDASARASYTPLTFVNSAPTQTIVSTTKSVATITKTLETATVSTSITSLNTGTSVSGSSTTFKYSTGDNMAPAVSTDDCGSTSGCFKVPDNCEDDKCLLIVKWVPKNDVITFTLFGAVQLANPYLAIGFSDDNEMGDDSVVLCSLNKAQNYFNTKEKDCKILTRPDIGISKVTTSKVNSGFLCSFDRLIATNQARSSGGNIFDLSEKFYALAAWGDFNAGSLVKHNQRFISAKKIDFLSTDVYSEDDSGNVKVKTHGCMMIIAWMFMASTGILMARYYKFLFPSVKINNVDFWFFIHQPVMYMVPAVTVVGFIVIFSQLNGEWIETNDKLEFTHSIFGIVTLGLAFIQPFIAIFRCGKDHKYRPIFNFLHRTFGLMAMVFSIVAMFLGVLIEDMNLGNIGWGLMLGWTIWVVLLPTILEIVDLRSRSGEKRYAVEATNDSNSKTTGCVKKLFLLMHLVVSLAFTIALIVQIAMAKKSEKRENEND